MINLRVLSIAVPVALGMLGAVQLAEPSALDLALALLIMTACVGAAGLYQRVQREVGP